MTDQDRDDEEFAWVRQAYLETPAATPALVKVAKMAVREVVSPLPATAQIISPASMSAVGSMTRLLPVWRRWQPATVVMTVAAVIIVLCWMRGYSSAAVRVPGRVAGLSSSVPHPPSVVASPLVSSTSVSSEAPDERGRPSTEQRGHEQTLPNTSHVLPHGLVPSSLGSPAILHTSSVANSALVLRMDSVARKEGVAPSSVVSVRPVGSDQSSISSSQSASARAVEGLDAESAVLVRRILDSASARGLPVTALASRVREGVQRGVPGPRIVVVTRNFAAALGDASTTLGLSASSLEIQAGAAAIVAGAPAAALRQIRTARLSGSIAEPLVALADLTTHGVAPLQASAALAALVAHDRSDVLIQTLRAHVVSDILRGTPPNAALSDQMHQTVPLDPPHSQAPFNSGGGVGSDSAVRRRPTP